MTAVPENFVSGMEGVVAFTTEIAEPDKDGGELRYRGVDIEELVEQRVTFGNVGGLLVDGKFGQGPAPRGAVPASDPHRGCASRRAGRAGDAGADLGLSADPRHRRPNGARPVGTGIGDGPVIRRAIRPWH